MVSEAPTSNKNLGSSLSGSFECINAEDIEKEEGFEYEDDSIISTCSEKLKTIRLDSVSTEGEISEQPLKEKCSNLVAEFHDFQKYLLKTVKDIRFNLTNKIANNMSRIDDAVQSGIIPILRDALKHTSDVELKYEILWIFVNISAGTSQHTSVLIEHDIVPELIRFVHISDLKLAENAVWALANICHDEPSICMQNCGSDLHLTTRLLELVRRGHSDLKTDICSRILDLSCEICEYLRKGATKDVPTHMIWVFYRLLENPKAEPKLIQETLKYLGGLTLTESSDCSDAYINALIQNEGNNKMIIGFLKHHPDQGVRLSALKFVGNILSGSDKHAQMLLKHGLMEIFHELMEEKALQQHVLLAMSNVAAGNKSHAQMVLNSQTLPMIVNMLNSHIKSIEPVDKAFEFESLWIISNLLQTLDATEMLSLEILPILHYCLVTMPVKDDALRTNLKSGTSNLLKTIKQRAHYDNLSASQFSELKDAAYKK